MTSSTQTAPRRQPEPEDDAQPETSGLGISTPQVAGSALAAVSAAVAASWLGVAGTIIGAAVGSIVATVGSAIYAQTLRRSGDAVRRIRTSRDGSTVTLGDPGRVRRWRDSLVDLPWRRVLIAAGVVLIVSLGAITVFERISGSSVSQLTGGSDQSSSTVGSVFGGGSQDSQERRDDDRDGTDEQVPAPQPSEPADQPEPEPTEEPDPTGTTSPTPTEEPVPTEEPAPTAPTTPVG